MALANPSSSAALSSSSLYSASHSLSKQPAFAVLPPATKPHAVPCQISDVHAAEPAPKYVTVPKPVEPTPSGKWTPDSWKLKKALQLPEYPNAKELEMVLKTIKNFPPIVFAGEARKLEERLADAAMGNAFLLQGGDCAESFKEFSASNIKDTFRVLLQMGVVHMFGGQ